MSRDKSSSKVMRNRLQNQTLEHAVLWDGCVVLLDLLGHLVLSVLLLLQHLLDVSSDGCLLPSLNGSVETKSIFMLVSFLHCYVSDAV